MRSPLGDTDQWLGGRGRTLYALAKVRYVHAGEQPPVAAQLVELAISERTYRTLVAELHRAVQERLESERPGGECGPLGGVVVSRRVRAAFTNRL